VPGAHASRGHRREGFLFLHPFLSPTAAATFEVANNSACTPNHGIHISPPEADPPLVDISIAVFSVSANMTACTPHPCTRTRGRQRFTRS
jgi:hypothetical protein